MSDSRVRALALWVALPLALAVVAFGLGRGARARGLIERTAAGDHDPDEALLSAALEDVVWRHGSPGDVRAVLRDFNSARAPSKERALRTRLRLAAVAETPDARAMLLSEACAIEPPRCSSLPSELARVASTRAWPHEAHLLGPPERPSTSMGTPPAASAIEPTIQQ